MGVSTDVTTVYLYEYTVYLPCINRISTVVDSGEIELKKAHCCAFFSYEVWVMNYELGILFKNAELFADFDEGSDTLIQLLLCMSSRELHADTRLALWHYWVVEARHINTFLL